MHCRMASYITGDGAYLAFSTFSGTNITPRLRREKRGSAHYSPRSVAEWEGSREGANAPQLVIETTYPFAAGNPENRGDLIPIEEYPGIVRLQLSRLARDESVQSTLITKASCGFERKRDLPCAPYQRSRGGVIERWTKIEGCSKTVLEQWNVKNASNGEQWLSYTAGNPAHFRVLSVA